MTCDKYGGPMQKGPNIRIYDRYPGVLLRSSRVPIVRSAILLKIPTFQVVLGDARLCFPYGIFDELPTVGCPKFANDIDLAGLRILIRLEAKSVSCPHGVIVVMRNIFF